MMEHDTLKNAFIISLVLCIMVGFFIQPDHTIFWWEEIPVFYAIYGFIGCVLIVIVSKELGHHLLQREEDYYEHD